MPLKKSAQKKLRQDKDRREQNNRAKRAAKEAILAMRKAPSEKLLTLAFAAIDRAKKIRVFHANKAARIKSRLTKLVLQKRPAASPKKSSPANKKKSPK